MLKFLVGGFSFIYRDTWAINWIFFLFLFGGNEKFRIFANGKGVVIICSPID